jgi:hypothetical protein
MNACQDTLEIPTHPLMATAMLVHATLVEQFKQAMEYQFVTQFRAIATARPTSSEKTVTNVKMASGTLLAVKVAKVAAAIRSDPTTVHATLTPDNASANLESLDFVATNVKPTIMDSRVRDANHAIVTAADQRVPSATNKVNVHATITLKDELAIVVKRTNTIVTKDAWTVQLATTWFKMLLMNIDRSCHSSTKF